MTNQSNFQKDTNPTMVFEIRIKGHLSGEWAVWFEGMTIMQAGNDETAISGPVVDQAALFGLLRKVRDLGLPLIAVRQVQSG